ncbi:MAG: hypothetical protein ACPG5P_05955, partial [Saprospiraceae bacterium]
NSKNIIPLKKNSIPKIIEEENEIEFIAQEENTSKQEEKSIKEIQETKTVLENPIADSNPKKDIFNPVQNTSTDKIKNTIPEIEELIPNNIIANTKLPNITRINPISISIAKIELPKEKLPKINIISPYQDIENHSRKGVLAKLEDAGFIPERQPRGGKLRNAFIPESFSSRN